MPLTLHQSFYPSSVILFLINFRAFPFLDCIKTFSKRFYFSNYGSPTPSCLNYPFNYFSSTLLEPTQISYSIYYRFQIIFYYYPFSSSSSSSSLNFFACTLIDNFNFNNLVNHLPFQYIFHFFIRIMNSFIFDDLIFF